jgi:hypothetical protein
MKKKELITCLEAYDDDAEILLWEWHETQDHCWSELWYVNQICSNQPHPDETELRHPYYFGISKSMCQYKAKDDTKRLKNALDKAGDAFWNMIAEEYPECKTGDLDPMAVFEFSDMCKKVVETWVDLNDSTGRY